MVSTPPTIPLATCKHCGKQFERSYRHRVYCSPACAKAAVATAVKSLYWADPDKARAKVKAWQNAHPGKLSEYNRKSHTVTCTICGAHKQRGYAYLMRDDFVCGPCKTAQRRVELSCYYCHGSIWKLPSKVTPRSACKNCHGILTVYAKRWGISRERVRQLVNEEVSNHAVRGELISRKDALALIDASRGNS